MTVERFDLVAESGNTWAASQHGVVDDDGWVWVIDTTTGWEDTPDVRNGAEDNARSDGADDPPPLYSSRSITITGTVTRAYCDDGRSPGPGEMVIRKFKALLARGNRIGVLTGTTDVVASASVRQSTKFETLALPSGHGDTVSYSWKMPLVANDPVLYGPRETRRAQLPQFGDGLELPAVLPAVLGVATPGGVLAVDNEGTIEYLTDRLVIYGEARNIRIANPLTGDELASLPSFYLAPGQFVVVNCRDHTAYLNGVAAVSGSFVSATDLWLPIDVGGAQLSFFADSPGQTSYCTFDQADASI